MRASWAETVATHPDPALRPRLYEAPPADVLASIARTIGDRGWLTLTEVDPRRSIVAAWVHLAPVAAVPGGPPKHPREAGRGWFHRLDPRVAQGWLQVRIEDAGKGKTQVTAHLRLELPFSGVLARILLKRFLWWLDVTRGEPRRP